MDYFDDEITKLGNIELNQLEYFDYNIDNKFNTVGLTLCDTFDKFLLYYKRYIISDFIQDEELIYWMALSYWDKHKFKQDFIKECTRGLTGKKLNKKIKRLNKQL
jgi:hypothetical protein